MPTVIVLDVSLSMARPVTSEGETLSRLQLAVQGINSLLDYFALYSKLEFVALVTFSSNYEVVSPFTRDFELLKSKLAHVEERDKSSIESVLHCVNNIVLSEWGTSTPCQVILITDGDVNGNITLFEQPNSPLPFAFTSKLNVITLTSSETVTPKLNQLIELAGYGSIITTENPLSSATVLKAFHKVAEENYTSFSGNLKCGNLECKVILSPPPAPYTKVFDFINESYTLSGTLEICGFIELSHVGSPAAVSRHLVLPHPVTTPLPQPTVKMEIDSDDESHDEGKIPSFCVLLHGSLKVENMAAMCQIGKNWYGVLYSWADSKKKSNLMLTILEPGVNSVSWLGNFKYLGVPEDSDNPNSEECFPVRPQQKRSYSQNIVVWIRQSGLQSDIQKILRYARKLPEKTQLFYKELNRVKRAAIAFGFIPLLDGLAAILDRECTILPGSAHPDCALQLTHAAGILRQPFSRDFKYNVLPMRTKFTDGD